MKSLPILSGLNLWRRDRGLLAATRGLAGWSALVLLSLPWLLFGPLPVSAAEPPSEAGSLLLTNAQQIVALGAKAASNQYDAQITGVVLYVSPNSRRLYIQDGKVGVQVNVSGSVEAYQVGNVVAVRGTVLESEPTVRLGSATAEPLGNAPLPEPKRTSVHRLVRGEDPYRRVSVRGMVRDMNSNRSGIRLLLTRDGYPFEVAIQAQDASLPTEWTDAELEVAGFAYPFYRQGGDRPTRIRFYAASTNDVQILTPGIADRFDGRPLLTLAEAAKLPQSLKPRYRVAGTVTVHRPGVAFFIDDGTGVMLVDTTLGFLSPPAGAAHLEREPQTTLQPGERVEVVGARHNWFSLTPSLMACEFRRMGRADPVRPIPVTISDLKAGRHSGKLVTLEARLVDLRTWGSSNLRQYAALVLRVDNDIFQARWESEKSEKWDLPTDSYVRITGVNDAEGGPNRKDSTFQIRLRSSADVVPAPEPPIWKRSEVQRLGLAMGAVGLLTGAWILLQRVQMRRLERRVAERTAELSSANTQLREEVAQRKRAEAERELALAQEKELNELKSRFVSLVSHEFRTPLGIIMSSAEILDAYLDRLTPEERRSNLRDIAHASKHMASLMEEVLLLSRVEAGKMVFSPSTVCLQSLCAKLADEVTSATGGRCPINIQTPLGMPDARADEALLRHILTNLLTNAVKYSAPGSPVDLTLESKGGLALFTVRDGGIGIPEADARQIFQAFHRGRNVGDRPGTGLGMVIVKRCVELHGGKIAFESKEKEGTRFMVALPLFKKEHTNPDGTTRLFGRIIETQNLTVIK